MSGVRWPVVWITGASTGIGRELALQLAAQGSRVAVSARSADKLAELASRDPRIVPFPLDVSDGEATRLTVSAIARDIGPIDLAVLNAGVWHPMGSAGFDAAKSAQSIDVNYLAVARVVEVLAPAMIARGRGRIAMTASVAGYRGLPNAAAYAPSKAALISLAECLAPDLARKGVGISVINPGFVETPMTAVNTFPMPFLMKAEDAARAIITGLERGRFEIAFPWQMVALLKLARVLPYPMFFWFARTFLTPRRRET